MSTQTVEKRDILTPPEENESNVLMTEQPPLDWFKGFVFPDKGISVITLSETFFTLFGKDLGKSFAQYEDWAINIVRPPHRINALPPEVLLQYQDAMSQVSLNLKRKTGFSAEQLEQFIDELYEKYEGETEAPFPIEVLTRN